MASRSCAPYVLALGAALLPVGGAAQDVVARPVVAADNPLRAASSIVESIDGFARP